VPAQRLTWRAKKRVVRRWKKRWMVNSLASPSFDYVYNVASRCGDVSLEMTTRNRNLRHKFDRLQSSAQEVCSCVLGSPPSSPL